MGRSIASTTSRIQGKLAQWEKFVRPMDWNHIESRRNGDWRLMKGDFGELIVRELLEGMGFRLERLQMRGIGLPDFKVSGLPVLIEVKAHKNKNKLKKPSKPPIWQRKAFIPIRRMGWKILIAHPQIKRNDSKTHIICSGIDWYMFGEDGRLESL